jgi:hypothetical protein
MLRFQGLKQAKWGWLIGLESRVDIGSLFHKAGFEIVMRRVKNKMETSSCLKEDRDATDVSKNET